MLFRSSSPDWLEARIEFHRRIAIPLAAMILALVGIPLGLSSHKGGKSMGVVLAVLVVVAYYSLFIGGISLARQGRLPVWAGVWMANFLFAAGGLFLLSRVDRVTPVFGWLFYLSEIVEDIQKRVSSRLTWKGRNGAAYSLPGRRH